ncbi:hypothetical protein CKA32_007128 [Geitlerinema sp. FC II]|nr:hypothetical protein CKA32_007128 [Geitlerinema sp. FC II]
MLKLQQVKLLPQKSLAVVTFILEFRALPTISPTTTTTHSH